MTWRSKKQSCVALSTAEAEYVALASAGQEAVWMRLLTAELCGKPRFMCLKTISPLSR